MWVLNYSQYMRRMQMFLILKINNMKIIIMTQLLKDDIIEINEQFWYEFELDGTDWDNPIVYTHHLQELWWLEWMQTWLDIWYILAWNNKLLAYTLIKI